jgi:hypothetical protein
MILTFLLRPLFLQALFQLDLLLGFKSLIVFQVALSMRVELVQDLPQFKNDVIAREHLLIFDFDLQFLDLLLGQSIFVLDLINGVMLSQSVLNLQDDRAVGRLAA